MQLHLILDDITDLFQELLKGHFTLSDGDDVTDDRLVLLQVDVPNLAEVQIRQDPVDPELPAEGLPVALLQSVRLELHHQTVDLGVALQELAHELVAGVLTQPGCKSNGKYEYKEHQVPISFFGVNITLLHNYLKVKILE